MFNRFRSDETGATAIEYGLIAAFIAILLIAVMTNLQGKINARTQHAPPAAEAAVKN